MKFMRYQNLFPKHLIFNAFAMIEYQKLIVGKCYFFLFFLVTSNRDLGKFLKIISQRVLAKLQTDTVFAQSLSNTYN